LRFSGVSSVKVRVKLIEQEGRVWYQIGSK
jgi:hypothetical protein